MVEWYRAGAPYEAVIDDSPGAGRRGRPRRRQRRARPIAAARADPFAAAERLTVADAFDRFAGIDLAGDLGDRDALAAAAVARGIRVAEDDSWSDIFSRVLVETVEPRLGLGRPSVLHSYPVSEAALARPNPSDHRLAERFEVYACGVELANGFGELTDAAEQDAVSLPKWTRKCASIQSVIRSTRISSPRSDRCRRHPASPSASTGWRCWRPARRISNIVQWNPVDTGEDTA